jgi:hypothetical protein
MEKGAYIVSRNPNDKFDIVFAIKPDVSTVSEIQQKLHLEVEKALVVIRKLFADNPLELESYFNQLLTLAQAGLVPENAQPQISLNALLQLKNEVVDKKSGEIKNSYFKLLGIQALKLGAGPLVLALFLKFAFYCYGSVDALKNLSTFANFLLLWSGCMLGIWLSFGARKTILSFAELTTIEEDRLEPLMRLLFAGAIAMVFSLLFYKQAISVNFGTISSKEIGTDPLVALIFGVFLGLSEQILGKKITKRAASLFENL